MRTLDLLRQVDRDRFHLDFCALSGDCGPLDAEVERFGSRVHLIRLGISFPREFASMLRREKYDVVHSHVFHSSGYILRLAKSAGVPVRIAHFRNTTNGKSARIDRQAKEWILRRLIDRNATRILAVSEGAMCEAWTPDWSRDSRCRVVYNTLDLAPFLRTDDRANVRAELGIPPDAQLVIHVGRMDPQKNHRRLLSIFACLAEHHRRVWLVCVGRIEAAVQADILATARSGGIADRIVIAGERSDVPSLLRASDLMIFPSLWEGMPGAVLEACIAGLPVVASDLPGVREIASKLPEAPLHVLSLDECDSVWSDVANKLLVGPSNGFFREGAVAAFQRSEFGVEHAISEHCQAWEGL